jgi:hypothetical protein
MPAPLRRSLDDSAAVRLSAPRGTAQSDGKITSLVRASVVRLRPAVAQLPQFGAVFAVSIDRDLALAAERRLWVDAVEKASF